MRNIKVNEIVTYKGVKCYFFTYNKKYKISVIEVDKDGHNEYWLIDDTDCLVYFMDYDETFYEFRTQHELRKEKLEKINEKC